MVSKDSLSFILGSALRKSSGKIGELEVKKHKNNPSETEQTDLQKYGK
jgi:hypothetical protein